MPVEGSSDVSNWEPKSRGGRQLWARHVSPAALDSPPLIPHTCIVDGHSDWPQPTSNQSIQNQPMRLLHGKSDYGDSSLPLYSMYSKIAEEEDNKMVELCQKDADGTLIFVSPYISPIDFTDQLEP